MVSRFMKRAAQSLRELLSQILPAGLPKNLFRLIGAPNLENDPRANEIYLIPVLDEKSIHRGLGSLAIGFQIIRNPYEVQRFGRILITSGTSPPPICFLL